MALAQPLLDGLQEVGRLILLNFQIGIAQHMEAARLQYVVARKKRIEITGNHVFQPNEPLTIFKRQQTRQRRRHLDAREKRLPFRIPHHQGQIQAEIRDVGEGTARVDPQWGEDRKDLCLEVGAQPIAISISKISIAKNLDAGGVQQRLQFFIEDPTLLLHHGEHDGAKLFELLGGGHAVRRQVDHAGLDLILQARDTDHEELVEIRAEDRQELDALEERMAGILHLLQHPAIELDPAQLPIEIQRRILEVDVQHRHVWSQRRLNNRQSLRIHPCLPSQQ